MRVALDPRSAAPEHLRVEVFSAVRGLALGGKIQTSRAAEALDALAEAEIEPIATATLLQRMWDLRNNVGGYDAAYVAAAEANACALITADARLARTRALGCQIRLALP